MYSIEIKALVGLICDQIKFRDSFDYFIVIIYICASKQGESVCGLLFCGKNIVRSVMLHSCS